MEKLYRIVDFIESTGQIIVEYNNYYGTISIDVPVENNKFIEGEQLNSYIKGFLPVSPVNRTSLVRTVTNKDYIKSLIEKSEGQFNIKDIYINRFRLLSSSDWTQLPDSPLDENQKNIWKKYRQKLRDIMAKPIYSDTKLPKPPKMLSVIRFVS